MHFGIFVEEKRHGVTQPEAFRDIFELADRAEAWGVHCVWLGEIHFTPTRSVISASLQVASAIASRTRRVRVGTAVQVLPSIIPAHRGGRHRRSDQRRPLSSDRASGVVRTYDVYGVPMPRARPAS